MNATEQLHSFTGTLTYDNKPLIINYNRLTKLILDKNTPSDKRADYTKQLEKSPARILAAAGEEPELLYFQRKGDLYLIRTCGSGRYNDHALSLQGSQRDWVAYSGTEPTQYIVARFGSGRGNLSVDDLLEDPFDITLTTEDRRSLNTYNFPTELPRFTDIREEFLITAEFKLTIIERNVAL